MQQGPFQISTSKVKRLLLGTPVGYAHNVRARRLTRRRLRVVEIVQLLTLAYKGAACPASPGRSSSDVLMARPLLKRSSSRPC